MGYDLHITRKKDWADDHGPVISAEEWLAYVATDSELRLDPNSKKHAVTINIQSGYIDPWLEWSNGDIHTKNPDEAIRAKMLQVASAFGAKVQGDDGEIYRSAKAEDYYYADGGDQNLKNESPTTPPKPPKVSFFPDAQWFCYFTLAFVGYLFISKPNPNTKQLVFRLALMLGAMVGLLVIWLRKRKSKK